MLGLDHKMWTTLLRAVALGASEHNAVVNLCLCASSLYIQYIYYKISTRENVWSMNYHCKLSLSINTAWDILLKAFFDSLQLFLQKPGPSQPFFKTILGLKSTTSFWFETARKSLFANMLQALRFQFFNKKHTAEVIPKACMFTVRAFPSQSLFFCSSSGVWTGSLKKPPTEVVQNQNGVNLHTGRSG